MWKARDTGKFYCFISLEKETQSLENEMYAAQDQPCCITSLQFVSEWVGLSTTRSCTLISQKYQHNNNVYIGVVDDVNVDDDDDQAN